MIVTKNKNDEAIDSSGAYIVLGKDNCEYCDKAVQQLEELGIEFSYLNVEDPDETSLVADIILFANKTTYPMILKVVGGSTDLTDQLMNDGYLV